MNPFLHYDLLRRLHSFSNGDLQGQIFESVFVANVDDSGADELLVNHVSRALDQTAEEVFIGGLDAGLESVLLDFGQSLDDLVSPTGLHHEIPDPRKLETKCLKYFFVLLSRTFN